MCQLIVAILHLDNLEDPLLAVHNRTSALEFPTSLQERRPS